MPFKPWPFLACCILVITGALWYSLWPIWPPSEFQAIFLDQRDLEKNNIVEVAVIGSGPAGLSAALYAARMNRYTVVFKGPMPGGQLTSTSDVENMPGVGTQRGPDIMENFEKQAGHFGARFDSSTIVRADFDKGYPHELETDNGTKIYAYTVIIATGATPKTTNIPGEQEYWGRGVSTCAVCDAPFYKDRDVAVIGGGDSAAEQALELSRFARSVTLLVRASTMRASAIMQQRLHEQPRIQILYNTQSIGIQGDGAQVTGMEIKELGKSSSLAVQGVFLAIGHDPNTKIFQGALATDKLGYIELKGRSQAASQPGVFAAGDVADPRYRQAGVAAGEGIKAALEADAFLSETLEPSEKLPGRYYDPQIIRHHTLESVQTLEQLTDHLGAEQRPVVIDFYAPYCTSCVAMLPVIESVAETLGDTIKFLKTDISTSDELSRKFEVTMVPTMLVMHEGKLLSRSTEVMNRQELLEYLQSFVRN